jgi:hypothetical protein
MPGFVPVGMQNFLYRQQPVLPAGRNEKLKTASKERLPVMLAGNACLEQIC